MTRMFCTLQEAAEILHTSEDQINTLLEQGLLHEFRQGPHRLVRQADIGVLDLLRPGPTNAQAVLEPPVPAPAPAKRTSARGRPGKREASSHRSAAARPGQAMRPQPERRRREDRGRRPERRKLRVEGKPRTPSCSVVRPPFSQVHPPLSAHSSPPAEPSVRQWFWMGLVQDRPAAIALLTGLILLGLSALAAAVGLIYEL